LEKEIKKENDIKNSLYKPRAPGSSNREIVSIHMGQCGIGIGESLWQLYCLEHGLEPNGKLKKNSSIFGEDDDGINTIFDEQLNGSYKPRAILVDPNYDRIFKRNRR
jgi:hypothetical protein